MKAVIFAGGVGTRLWPLSRKTLPKQFEKIIGEKSTLQLAVERLLPEFSWQDIYISTGEQYGKLVKDQLPQVPVENIILEPEMKDVGPAVGLVCTVLNKISSNTPFAILWSDHLIKNTELFKKALLNAGKVLEEDPERIIFMGQKPRFASQNLGWIEFGKKIKELNGLDLFEFKNWHYRPEISEAEKFLQDGHHLWNPGYFVVTPKFLLKQYEKFAPRIYQGLMKIAENYGEETYTAILKEVYVDFPKISFDNAILEHLPSELASVLGVDLGWSDVGAWEALKEALAKFPADNVIHGKVEIRDCEDSLIYNYTDQLLAAIDLKSQLVINTKDVTLVCHKDSVPKIKKLVEELEKTEFKDLT